MEQFTGEVPAHGEQFHAEQSTGPPWVNFFRMLGQNKAFPKPDAANDEWQSFVQAVLICPISIVIIGVVLSAALLCFLCCGRSRDRSRQQVLRPPSSKPLLCVAVFTFAAIVVSSLACWSTGIRSFSTANEQLSHAVTDLDSAKTTGNKLNATGTDMLQQLDALYAMCPATTRQLIKSQLDPTVTQLDTALASLSAYTENVSALAKRLDDVQSSSDEAFTLAAAGLALPMVFVTAACLVIFLAALVTRGCGGASMARCNDCCLMRLGSIFITGSVLFAVAVAASETAAGTFTGSFCHDVDTNVLLYAQNAFGANSKEFVATSFYITGVGTNPLNQTLTESRASVNQAQEKFLQLDKEYQMAIALRPDLACKDKNGKAWTANATLADIAQLGAGIDDAKILVSRPNIYPYYDKVVHVDACGTVLAGLGGLVVCQLLVGLLCLPVLAIVSASFFTNWAAWKEATAGHFLRGGNPEVHLVVGGSQVEATPV